MDNKDNGGPLATYDGAEIAVVHTLHGQQYYLKPAVDRLLAEQTQPPVPRAEAVRIEGEPEESFYRRIVFNNGWNACHAAHIAGTSQAALVADAAQWRRFADFSAKEGLHGEAYDNARLAFELGMEVADTSQETKAQAEPEDSKNALEMLREADDLLWIASDAMLKMGLRDKGSDCGLPHEVRKFALEFSSEGRDGPGALQVRGTGRYRAWLTAVRKLCAAPVAKEAPAVPEWLAKMVGAMSEDEQEEFARFFHDLSNKEATKEADQEQQANVLQPFAAPASQHNARDPNWLLSTMDGKDWADEFCRLNNAADHGMMLGWFCNAIMTGYDAGRRHEADEQSSTAGSAKGGNTNTESGSDLAPTTSTVSAPEEVRCKCCGYLVTESEHRGCLRSSVPSEARNQALEDAAHECERHVNKDPSYAIACTDCAESIRALKRPTSTDTGSAA